MRLPMLASLCTVPFLFFKATEAQGNWFGGRPTVASPSVKKTQFGVTDHRGRIHRIGIQILDTPNGAVGRGKGATVWRRNPSSSIDGRSSALRTADRDIQCGCRSVTSPVFLAEFATALRARRTYRSPRFLLRIAATDAADEHRAT